MRIIPSENAKKLAFNCFIILTPVPQKYACNFASFKNTKVQKISYVAVKTPTFAGS